MNVLVEKNLKIVALVPLKLNSERVPGKNFKLLHDRPLYRWILDTLCEIDSISEIIINTDARDELFLDPNIRDSCKIRIRARKEELQGDYVSMNHVLADDVNAVEADVYLMTHVTNPLLAADTITRAINKFIGERETSGVDSLFSVNRFQSRFYTADGSPLNHDPGNLVPTQHLDPLFEENSNIYIFTRESFLSSGARIGNKPTMFETPSLESLDIDTMEDWNLVEKVASLLSRHT